MAQDHQCRAGWRCPECQMIRVADDSGMGMGVDPCLGKLPGVKAACCGHGGKGNSGGYLYFENGTVVRFEKLTAIERE